MKKVDSIAKLAAKCRVSLNCKRHDPPYTIFLNGVGVMPLGDIFAIKAKAKQGKTQAATILMAGVLGSERFGIRAAPSKQPKVLYIDTEQAKDNTIIVGHRVHNLLGWEIEGDHKEFWTFNVRTESIINKKLIIEYEIRTTCPTIIIIDGVADLITNFNDVKESHELILWLMQMAERHRVAIGCVIHENKAKEDGGMKGHLGTLILQKASDIFEVTNNKGLFKLLHDTSRNCPAGSITWCIEDGMLVRNDKNPDQVTQEMKEEHLRLWAIVFEKAGGPLVGYNAIKQSYMAIYNVSEKTARNHMKKAISKGFIKKTNGGQYEVSK